MVVVIVVEVRGGGRRKEGEKDASGSDDGEKLHLELEGRVWRDDWGEAPRAVSLSTESS